MYYDDDPKKNRSKLFMIIGGVVLLIIMIIFIVSCTSKRKTETKDNEEPKNDIGCELEVKDAKENSKGEYEGEVKVIFKSKTPSNIKTYGIGLSKTYNGSTTYLLNTKGQKTVYGYVKDSDGNEAKCEISITITDKTEEDGCVLEAKGTAGESGWYRSNVDITFKKKAEEGIKVVKYGLAEFPIDEEKTEGTADEKEKDIPFNSKDKHTVEKDGKADVYGIVEDEDGNVERCKLTIKKDTVAPSCTLKVTSGTKSGDIYSNNVTLEIDTYTDLLTKTISKGIGIEKNYDKTSYTVSQDGTTMVYGYVKDEAGNEGTCQTTINKNTSSPTNPNPTCSLRVSSGTIGTNGWYKSDVGITFSSKNNASDYGINTSKVYNGSTTFTARSEGSYNVYGYVKSSSGKEATCSINVKKDTSVPTCALKVTSGTKSGDAYTSSVTIGFAVKDDTISGIASYGIGTSETFSGNTSFTISNNGAKTIYGYVKDNAGNVGTCSINITINNQGNLLSSKVSVGDYVQYDSGNWTETKALPTTASTPFSFGGYTNGKSRNNGIDCSNGATSTSGWRVLSITGTTVKLIHASTPECFYHPAINGQTNLAYNSEKILTSGTTGTPNVSYTSNPRSWGMYVNSNYAVSATVFTKPMLDTYMGYQVGSATQITDPLIKTSTNYYLGSSLNSGALWATSASGYIQGYSLRVFGVRPVVTLKANVKTTGKNASGKWELTL